MTVPTCAVPARASFGVGVVLLLIAGQATIAAPARADVITDWNSVLLNAVRTDRTAPPKASRAMAMVNASMFDAVNAINRRYTPYLPTDLAPAGTSREAAAAVAAHRVLTGLYPAQAATFDAALASTLAGVPDGAGKTDGINLGTSCSTQMLNVRATDGWDDNTPYTPGTGPGKWQPTPPGFQSALLPNWGKVRPFGMTTGSQFRKAGPAALSSTAYADAYNEVKEIGSRTSSTRTAEQTEIAHFWADGGGTATPPGHWHEIARAVGEARGNTVEQNARMFALLSMATADAGIAAWDMKYTYEFWRPVTAIRQGDTDGNDFTSPDPLWEPLIATPPFPEYVSGHSTFSGAAARLLAQFFGTDSIAFDTTSDGLVGVTRSFDSFSEAAAEAGKSRIYGGIHFEFSNTDGLTTGAEIGDYLFANYLTPIPAPAALTVLGGVVLGLATRRRR